MSSPILIKVSKNTTPFILRPSNPDGSVILTLGHTITGPISLKGPQGEPSVRGLSGFCAAFPLSNEYVLYGVAPYDFDLTTSECRAVALAPATNEVIFKIYRIDANDVQEQIGTITFATGEDTATFNFIEINILKNEKLLVQAPTDIDASLSNITFLLV